METRTPLDGQKILILRHPDAAASMTQGITNLGGKVDAVPAIAITPIPSGIAQITPEILGPIDTLIITSNETVSILFKIHTIIDLLKLKSYIAVGPSTYQSLINAGIPAHQIKISSIHSAKGIRDEWGASLAHDHVLYPTSEAADPSLIKSLQCASVTQVALYRPETIKIAIAHANQYDYIVMTSGSIARSFFSQYPPETLVATYIAMGQQTADVIRSYSSRVITAYPSTQEGIIKALVSLQST
ncbi:uroporphyrinogen-III synthase [bacterium]|nr:uroporphyrinogen-III synthase [bacterium]